MSFDELKAAYLKEELENNTPESINEIPIWRQLISPDWLSCALCQNDPSKKVVDFKQGPFTWNGLLPFCLPTFTFLVWFCCTNFTLFRALGRQEEVMKP